MSIYLDSYEVRKPHRHKLEKNMRKRHFNVTIVESEGGQLLVDVHYEVKGNYSTSRTVDMFLAKDEQDVIQTIKEAAESAFRLEAV